MWSFSLVQRTPFQGVNITPQATWSFTGTFANPAIFALDDGTVLVEAQRGTVGVKSIFQVAPATQTVSQSSLQTLVYVGFPFFTSGPQNSLGVAGSFGSSLNLTYWEEIQGGISTIRALPFDGISQLYANSGGQPGSQQISGGNPAFNPDGMRFPGLRSFEIAFEFRPSAGQPAGGQGIGLSRIDVNGPIGPLHIINDVSRIESDPSIAPLPFYSSGLGYAVAYSSSFAGGGGSEIWLARYDGVSQQTNVSVDGIGSINDQAELATLSTGSTVLVYRDNGWSIDQTEITGIIYNPDGTERRGYFIANAGDTAGAQSDPQVIGLPDGFFAVAWVTKLATEEPRVTWRVFDSAGNPVGGLRSAVFGTTEPTLTAFGDGRFMVGYRNLNSPEGSNLLAAIDEIRGSFDGTTSLERIEGTGFADLIRALAGNDTVFGGSGSDTIFGGENDDLILGNSYNDQLHGDGGKDTIDGGEGNDTIDGGEGDDVLAGGTGLTTITGGSGNDLISAVGAGGDPYERQGFMANGHTLDGGIGNDIFRGQNGATAFIGGVGIDTVEYLIPTYGGFVEGTDASGNYFIRDIFLGVIVDLTSPISSNTGADQDTFNGIENVTGTSEDDTLRGDGFANLLKGLAKSDTLVGRGGNDTLDGGAGQDSMTGGAEDDTYLVDALGDSTIEQAGGGTDTVQSTINWTLGAEIERLELTGAAAIDGTGNGLNNHMLGNVSANRLAGGVGNDTLLGGQGADTLNGGAGKDLFTGGGGLDQFVFSALGDSGTSFATRDVINTFAHGDKIVLTALDARTDQTGDQAFVFIGASAFSGVAGQLRFDMTNISTTGVKAYTIQGDVNGDRIADVSLQIYTAPTTDRTGQVQRWDLFGWDFQL